MKKLLILLLAMVASFETMLAEIQNPAPLGGIWYDFRTAATRFEALVTYMDGDWKNNSYSGNIIIPSSVFYQYLDPATFQTERVKYIVYGISSYAFYGCPSLESISLPTTIKSIGAYAFYGDVKLQTIILPDSLESIGGGAFEGCTGLKYIACRSITPPSLNTYDFVNVDTIYVRVGSVKAYKSATNWRNFKAIIPMSDTGTCGEKTSWKWDLETKTLTITGTDTMPNYAKGTDVPWSDCLPYIEHVNISDGIISIGDYAFANCSNLVSVKIGSNITTIGNYAFYKCDKITSFNIPDNVREVKNYALGYCSGVKSLYIGKNVKRILSQAFYSTIIDTINWNARNIEMVYNYNTSPFRGGVARIVNLGDDVTQIPDYLFYNNTKLKKVSFGKNISSIGESTFSQCDALDTIYWNVKNFPDDSIRSRYQHKLPKYRQLIFGNDVEKIPSYFCYSGGIKIKSITIPDNIKKIGHHAFYECDSLKEVSLGNGLDSIGSYAFSYTNIRNITIPDNIKRIGNHAFYKCDSLKEVSLGNGLDSIGSYAFSYTNIRNITIPDNVKRIGNDAFYSCNNLEIVSLGHGIEFIGDYAFYGTKIRDILIPDNVKTIDVFAFGSDSLRTAYVGSGLDSIGGQIFCTTSVMDTVYWNVKEVRGLFPSYSRKQCLPNVKNVVFGPNAEIIPSYLTNDNSFLHEIIIPDNIVRVESGAFSGCDSVTYIYIGKNVKYIGGGAFEFDNNSCKKRFIWNAENYSDDGEKLKYIIGGGHVDDYNKDLFDTITIGNDVKRISQSFFESMVNIKYVNIPSTVKTIANRAFSWCISLTSLLIPQDIDSIGDYAFSGVPNIEYNGDAEDYRNDNWGAESRNGVVEEYFVYEDEEKSKLLACSNIASGNIIIPQHVKVIRKQAFYERSKITSVTIPGTVKIIPYGTFASMRNLNSVYLEDGVEEIEQYAFHNDQALVYISFPKSLQQISSPAFEGTPLMDENKWKNGLLYINDWLISSDNTISGDIIIPDNTRGLAEIALAGKSSVTSITLPQSVVRIGERAFSGCSSLKSMILPDSVTMIRYSTFLGCSSLEEIKMSPYTISIGEEAFRDCQKLTTIKIPKSLKEIGWRAFEGCSNINAVYIDDLRAWCDIKTFSNPLEYSGNLYLNDTLITHLTIPEGVKNLRVHRFINDKNLASVAIPSTLDSIEHQVFYGCTNIVSVTWNATNCHVSQDDYTNDSPFPYDNKISNFTFGENVESIPADLCRNLELDTIRIPKKVRSIGMRAFKECHYANAVISEAITPPTMLYEDYEEAPFYGNYCDLYVPAESINAYKNSKGWNNFYNIYPIGLKKAYVDSTTVEVYDHYILISWQSVQNARRYEISIYEDSNIVYQLTFDSYGNLIDYKHSMSKMNRSFASKSESQGWQYIIKDLTPNTHYSYKIDAFNYNNSIIVSCEGEFTTNEESTLDIGNILDNNAQSTKVLHDGQIFILRGDKTYTTDGRLVR